MKKKTKEAPVLDRGVAWTAEMRDEVWPWRGHPNPAFRKDYVERSCDLVAAFAERRQYMDYDEHMRPWFRAGLKRVPVGERAMMEGALAIRDETTMPTKLDPDVEVALVALEIQHVFTAVPFWIAKEGLEMALRTLVRCHAYHSSGHDEGYGDHGVWVVHAPDGAGSYPEYAESGWEVLRARLATADDATYASMREVAEELRANAPTVVRAFLAIAFATERDWADEAAEAALAEEHPSAWCKRLVTVASLELGARLARNERWAFEEGEILTLLAREGGAAVPVLGAALSAAGNNDERKRYAKLLARIETEDAARAFVPWMANKAVSPIATSYFKRVPEVARRALSPIAKSNGPGARAAAIALKSL